MNSKAKHVARAAADGPTAVPAPSERTAPPSFWGTVKSDARAWTMLVLMGLQALCTLYAYYCFVMAVRLCFWMAVGIRAGMPLGNLIFIGWYAIGLIPCPAFTFCANYVTRWCGPRALRLMVIPPLCIGALMIIVFIANRIAAAQMGR